MVGMRQESEIEPLHEELLARKKRQHAAFVSARLILVSLFIILWPLMFVLRLYLPIGFLVALLVEAACLVIYGRATRGVRDVRTLDRYHYLLLVGEIGFHTAMVYYLGGVSWLGAISYIYAILYANAFLPWRQALVFAAALSVTATSMMILEARGVVAHQWFLEQGPERFQDPRFLATSAIMFVGVMFTISFWMAWIGSEMRRERDEALKAADSLGSMQEELRQLNEELERKVQERTEALAWRAEHDQLTGLLNRGAIARRCQELIALAQRTDKPLAVVMADADGFKRCNDVGGHLHGDEVLRLMAHALRSACRGTDLVGRLGGDEFLVVLFDATHEGVRRLVESAHESLDRMRALATDPRLPLPYLSFGAAFFPEHGSDVEELVRVADHAMYRVKQRGGRSWEIGVAADAVAPVSTTKSFIKDETPAHG